MIIIFFCTISDIQTNLSVIFRIIKGLTGAEINTIINRQNKSRCIRITHTSHFYQIRDKHINTRTGFKG